MYLFNGQQFINTKKSYMIIDGQVFCEKKGWLSLEEWKQQCKKEFELETTSRNNSSHRLNTITKR